MHGVAFLKGMGVGLVVGATVTGLVAPMDKKKMMKGGAGRTLKAIGEAVEHFM